jgi:uncharacterized damage-inducible protein DinB
LFITEPINVISTIIGFEALWSREIEATQKILKHITDKSLSQAITPQNRTLGRLAWHITTSISEMMSRTGLSVDGPGPDDPVPASTKLIFQSYNTAAISLLDRIKSSWTDETLKVEDDMYGQRWKRGFTLTSLILHQAHHRGQMTVLMRQAGLDVPGIYGPARQEWGMYGMREPEV